MEILIQTSFFKALVENDAVSDIGSSYKEFIYKLFEICNNRLSDYCYGELYFTLNNTLIELHSLRALHESNQNMEYISYIHKASRFIERAIQYIEQNKELYSRQAPLVKPHRWTSDIIYLVEVLYAFHTRKCVDDGDITIEDLAEFMGKMFSIELKHFYITYTAMKRRKGDSRTYFLDELAIRLNERMDADENKFRLRTR